MVNSRRNSTDDVNQAPTPPAVTASTLILHANDAQTNSRKLFVCRVDMPLNSGQQLHVLDGNGNVCNTVVLAVQGAGYEQACPQPTATSLAALNLLNVAAMAAGRQSSSFPGLSPMMLHSLAAAKLAMPQQYHNNQMFGVSPRVSCFSPNIQKLSVDQSYDDESDMVEANVSMAQCKRSSHTDTTIMSPTSSTHSDHDSQHPLMSASFKMPTTGTTGSASVDCSMISGGIATESAIMDDAQRLSSSAPAFPKGKLSVSEQNGDAMNKDHNVDGINLEEIKQFAKAFKMKRLSLGLTQTQVGQALSMTEGPAYSQSAICRFEKLDITPKSAQKIKPVLEKWMREMDGKLYGNDQILASTALMSNNNNNNNSILCSEDDNNDDELISEMLASTSDHDHVKHQHKSSLSDVKPRFSFSSHSSTTSSINVPSTTTITSADTMTTAQYAGLLPNMNTLSALVQQQQQQQQQQLLQQQQQNNNSFNSNGNAFLANGIATTSAELRALLSAAGTTRSTNGLTYCGLDAATAAAMLCAESVQSLLNGQVNNGMDTNGMADGANDNAVLNGHGLMDRGLDGVDSRHSTCDESSLLDSPCNGNGMVGGLMASNSSCVSVEIGKKRKRRTSFTPHALDMLNRFFEHNTHPSGSEMTALAESLNYDREVVRVWFCNKRQALKNTIKKLKNSGPETMRPQQLVPM